MPTLAGIKADVPHWAGYSEIEGGSVAKLREATLAATKEKLKGGTMRRVAYEAHQWISQMFVKGKGRIDSMTAREAARVLTGLRSSNNMMAFTQVTGIRRCQPLQI